jgi:putative tryptophan/tyrosine transport system substrate-binding protein
MRRRSIISGFAALLLFPEGSSAQQSPGTIPRIGILGPGESERTPIFDAFREGLHDLGYIEGRNIILEFRLARGDYSLFPQLTAELVKLPVDIIVSDGGVRLVAKASGQVPVVIPTLFDPVAQEVASSLSRPGGNVTGFTLMTAELDAKRLELLRTAFPQITAVSVLVDPSVPAQLLMLERIEKAAKSMGLGSVRKVEALTIEALRALRPAVFSGASAVLVVGSGMFWNYRRYIVALVNEARLPAIYPEREYADDGGLLVYGANVPDNFRRAADYVDRILKGAKPGDLPIQEPVRFDFVVNLKTARELSLTIPPAILARADEVIE